VSQSSSALFFATIFVMSPKEQAIAEAALRPYPASDYDELFDEIAEYTGYSREDVEDIINDLVVDKTLIDKHVPMLDPTPVGTGIVKECYDKGPMWGNPNRVSLIW
jgi:hypothetical protein